MKAGTKEIAPRVVGVTPASAGLVAEEWIRRGGHAINIVLVHEMSVAERLAEDIAMFGRAGQAQAEPRGATHVFPELREGDSSELENFDLASDRLAVLEHLARSSPDTPVTVVTTPAAILQPVPAPSWLAEHSLCLKAGAVLPHGELVERLHAMNYDCEALCEAPGQFAVRGGLVDVYPITGDRPFRVDFFGDEVEEIRAFDPVTQRSSDKVQAITIPPPPQDLQSLDGAVLLPAYAQAPIHWLILEPEDIAAAVSSQARAGVAEAANWMAFMRRRADEGDVFSELSDLDLGTDDEDSAREPAAFDAEPLSHYRSLADERRLADERLIEEQSQRSRFFEYLGKWARAGERIVIILPRSGEEQRVIELLHEAPGLGDLNPQFLVGSINEGFRVVFREGHERLTWPSLDKAAGLVVVSETEIFGCKRRRRPRGRAKQLVNQSQVDQLLDFSELVEGEFVVHLQHGIAIYRGCSRIELRGETREVLTLEFDAGVQLHVPLQESHLVSRYVGLTKAQVQLGKIGSGRWEKVRAAAERATLDYAARLLETQAQRSVAAGIAFAPDTEWQREFEAAFPYRETPDQLTAIRDVKADMERPEPMDRLICGDVGFGKTEVALRAAFKAVMSGRQVAVLVPTTVLAQQHFQTFRERMSGFPIVVEMVSRFRTRSEQTRILNAVREGRVDILVGTHRLVQSDVNFKDLGLVVIDEEQRFGLKHKEVFKEWRANVDIISMSATPIPRTLYMALTSARSLSVIETPPAERRPIQTVVKSYSDKLVREVILNEVRRGGQVYYLHNRVQTIDNVAHRLRELLPEVTFAVGHGQMGEKQLERVMLEFMDGRFQVLVCTTIIESGIDIPSCNTIIIEGADRFGLSQLYQLRGRVGRFRHQAYAYLLLHRHARLLDIARKRLNAIRHHNQLGAGFRIAMRDLELRGAGNLLGAEQSGHIVGVGFELYCQLLRQSIARLKGEPAATTIRATVKLDFVMLGQRTESTGLPQGGRHSDGFTALKDKELEEGFIPAIEAYIPTDYVSETQLRVSIHRDLALADSVEAVRALGRDLQDRFGKPPAPVQALLTITEIRCLAERKRILSVETEGNRLKLRRVSSKRDDFVMLGKRFPRLTAKSALPRLKEIRSFLNNLPD